ncbi:MAG: carbohydrate kinase family protein [Candidatus Hadarchaeum sp.]|uniref:carbohydrate kinase family protein n=1 Tax=Candidatus Hadarchaeum sp. TaxID=2883567 RepID=UPI003D11EA60
MAPDVVVVGHVALDVNVFPWGVVENVLGGAPTYSGLQFAALKLEVGLVSKVGIDFTEKFPPIYRKLGLDTEGIYVAGEHTTTFENTYDEQGNRTQVCKHVAPPITPADVPGSYLDAKAFYVSPIANEITPELLRFIKRESNFVMLDPQGILRVIGADGRVGVRPRDLSEFLRHVDIVKLGREEAVVLRGNVEEGMRSVQEMGPGIVIVTRGGEPTLVLSGEGFTRIDPLKVGVRDMTGAGDVFGAAFLTRYLATRDVMDAAKFATAAAGLKIRYKGPTGFPTEPEILEAVQRLG